MNIVYAKLVPGENDGGASCGVAGRLRLMQGQFS